MSLNFTLKRPGREVSKFNLFLKRPPSEFSNFHRVTGYRVRSSEKREVCSKLVPLFPCDPVEENISIFQVSSREMLEKGIPNRQQRVFQHSELGRVRDKRNRGPDRRFGARPRVKRAPPLILLSLAFADSENR